MSNLIGWEPMRETISLREAMDRLFDDAFTRSLSLDEGLRMPAIDMYQTDDEVVIKAALPGIKSGDVQISITGDMLTLKGEYKDQEETQEKAYHLREQRFGSFERTLMLPTNVVADKAKADFEDGILSIILPKAGEVHPKTINVKAK